MKFMEQGVGNLKLKEVVESAQMFHFKVSANTHTHRDWSRSGKAKGKTITGTKYV